MLSTVLGSTVLQKNICELHLVLQESICIFPLLYSGVHYSVKVNV